MVDKSYQVNFGCYSLWSDIVVNGENRGWLDKRLQTVVQITAVLCVRFLVDFMVAPWIPYVFRNRKEI